MSSILTNNGAMVALQTLKSINSDLGKTQSMISTGKEVASAKDNAAVWAISQVDGRRREGLQSVFPTASALARRPLPLARHAAETVHRPSDRHQRQDRRCPGRERRPYGKLQTDISALTEQIQIRCRRRAVQRPEPCRWFKHR